MHAFIYENAGVSARATVRWHASGVVEVNLWMSRKDLFQADPDADGWLAHELLPFIGDAPRLVYVHGPDFSQPPVYIGNPFPPSPDGNTKPENQPTS